LRRPGSAGKLCACARADPRMGARAAVFIVPSNRRRPGMPRRAFRDAIPHPVRKRTATPRLALGPLASPTRRRMTRPFGDSVQLFGSPGLIGASTRHAAAACHRLGARRPGTAPVWVTARSKRWSRRSPSSAKRMRSWSRRSLWPVGGLGLVTPLMRTFHRESAAPGFPVLGDAVQLVSQPGPEPIDGFRARYLPRPAPAPRPRRTTGRHRCRHE